jgi:hypothetical protein
VAETTAVGPDIRGKVLAAFTGGIFVPALAVLACVVLEIYSGPVFWGLLAFHAAITGTAGWLIMQLSGRLNIFGDMVFGYALWFAALVGAGQVDAVGDAVVRPLAGFAASVVQPVSQAHAALVAAAEDAAGSLNRQFLASSNWDEGPMPPDVARSHIKTISLGPVRAGNQTGVKLTVHNGSNGVLKSLTVQLQVGAVMSKPLAFTAAQAVLPGQTGTFSAVMDAAFAAQSTRAKGTDLTWTAGGVVLVLQSVDLAGFDRQAHIARNLNKWLDQ